MAPSPDPILRRELPIIAQIIHDETWLEAERRGCFVTADDPAVRNKVCETVLRIGADLRQSLLQQCGVPADAPDAA